MTETLTDPDHTAALASLDRLRSDRFALGSTASAHRLQADRLRALAARIDTSADPLPRTLDHVDTLHTVHTWEGRAAADSRLRLDRHRSTLDDALRSARGLADDLRAEASNEDRRAADADTDADALLRQIAQLELDLGHFDHV